MSTQQTTAVVPAARPSLITAMASKYQIDPTKFLATLKATILAKATDEEMQSFCIVAHEYGLNPFLKEIHAFPNKAGGITPVVGVDGWCSLMNRRPEFDGIEFTSDDDADGKPHSVTARIFVKGRSRPIMVTEYFSECSRNTDPWRLQPRRMLRHKALIQCARVAFGFAGIHDEDEAQTIASVTVDEIPKPIFKQRPTKQIAAPAVESDDQIPGAEVEANPPAVPVGTTPVNDPNAPLSPQDQLAALVTGAGFTFDQWQSWAMKSGFAKHESDSFSSVGVALASRLVKSKSDTIDALKEFVGGAK